jgi:hypothetical protein
VLWKFAYLTLCRSIQLLVLLARGDAAKDLEILVLRHQLAVLRAKPNNPGSILPTGQCLPVGARYSVTSCDLRILVKQPAESISSHNPSGRQDDRWVDGPERHCLGCDVGRQHLPLKVDTPALQNSQSPRRCSPYREAGSVLGRLGTLRP